jgi:hypothetical protein
VDGIYTQEIETANDDKWKDIKCRRMLERWTKILCPYININDLRQYLGDNNDKLGENQDRERVSLMLMKMIQLQLNDLNAEKEGDRDRTFSIKVDYYRDSNQEVPSIRGLPFNLHVQKLPIRVSDER